jgi:AcrR family transcriptional regulator
MLWVATPSVCYDASNYSLSQLAFCSLFKKWPMPKVKPLADHTALYPRKIPVQDRAAATRDAILQAAALVLQREEFSAFNTNRVAEVAGISIGSLYQYYPNKAALLTALTIQQHAQLLVKIERAIEKTLKLSMEKAIDKLLITVLAHQFENPELARALDYAERALTPTDEMLMQKKLMIASLTQMMSRYRDQITGDLRVAALDVQTIVQAMIDGAELRGETNRPALRKRVGRAVLGYLKT